MRFNVIGHITSDIGLGVMACDLMQALYNLGHEVAGYDVDLGSARQNRSQRMAQFLRPASEMYRDGVDVAVFPVSSAEHWSRTYLFGAQRVAVVLWELPDINDQWLHGLRRFDGVVSSSDFIYDTLTAAGVEVWRGQHPHYIDDVQPNRSLFDLPDDKVIFTFAFDPSSDVRRKNPQAVVEAFQRADAPNSLLCLQINKSAEVFAPLERWLRELPADRVKIINRHLNHHEAVQLIASSDVYISLHRAEGFGLGMHEAMQLGKPVIATAWSGNMSFMDDTSAGLVKAELIPLDGIIPAYTPDVLHKTTHWAEPNIEQAAQWIGELAQDAELRAELGAAAQRQAHVYQAQARRLDWIAQIPEARSISIPASRASVLVFTPTWIDEETGEDAIQPEVAAMIKAQIGVEFDWHITVDNPWPIGDHRNVLYQYQMARDYFLNGRWEMLVTIEYDNLLPDELALQRMVETIGDCIYAPYILRHGTPQLSTWRYVGNRTLGKSLSHYPGELARARAEVVHRVSGAGMGCTLFRRRVVEAIPFAASSQGNICPDLGFAKGALRAYYTAYGRFDVPVLHWSKDHWLHPYGEPC